MKSRFVRIHLPALLMALVIFVLSSIPSLEGPDLGFQFQDKIYHFFEYAVFGFLLLRSFGDRVRIRRWAVLSAFCAGAVFAGLDELHQSLVPGREADWADFLADSAGLLFSVFPYWFFIRKK